MHTVKNAPQPTQTLEVWLTLEVLTSQQLPKPKDLEALNRQLVRLDAFPDPWFRPSASTDPREKDHYWFVFLGELDLNAATESMLEIFPNKGGGEFGSKQGETTMAAIVLDSKGRPVEEKTFLSSFAWGYGKVRAGELNMLHTFIEDEDKILAEFNKKLITQDEDGKIRPIDTQQISALCDWLIKRLNLPIEQIKTPGIAVRVPVFSTKKEVPEPELLNSFFLEDLHLIKSEYVKGKTIGTALDTYMKAKSAKHYADVVSDGSLLKNTLRPSRIPLTRWPAKGRFPLYMMQQAAVNHIRDELVSPGLAAVNGPPGTGKTTLLRDVVANVVFDRANLLADYEDPEQAFSHVGKIRTGSAFTHLYDMDERLLGHEIVVASSNNKAVENISRDIPGIDEIADDFAEPLRYFSTLADLLAANKKDKNSAALPGCCWGTAAAALGNSSNKNAFVNDFWWNDTYGMKAYLKSVGKELNDDTPQIALLENAPTSPQQALETWYTVREAFKKQKYKVSEKIIYLETIFESLLKISKVAEQLALAKAHYEQCLDKLNTKQNHQVELQGLLESCLEDEKTNLALLSATKELKPGFFSRLIRTDVFKNWKKELTEVLGQLKLVATNKKELKKQISEAQKDYSKTDSAKTKADQSLTPIKGKYAVLQKNVEIGKDLLGENFPDEEFWNKHDSIKQKMLPWINKQLQDERDELFVLSFKVHRAFIDVAAKQMRNNLATLMNLLKNGSLDSDYQKTIPSLWASLFMVVPVVSTTFASFSRLFSSLKREQIGWLLLDESGQALPQAAVGAMWRSTRVVVIGDPLQIEPVVTIPNQLIKAIFNEYHVEIDDWAPPVMSVQTLTDRTSWFGSMVETNDGEIWVGSPLRVHRRCIEPMFSIANKVAYNGLMVSATPKSHSTIGEILGDSVWFDLDSKSIGKWSRKEGELVITLIHRLFDGGIAEPDVYIITPFRNIADQLKRMMTHDARIRHVIGAKDVWAWANNRIGTVHTFQGKEAEAVIFVLGATGDEHNGARAWAGKSPNILNVAVTRAKSRLYVVGHHKEWQGAGMFRSLSDKLKKSIIDSPHTSVV